MIGGGIIKAKYSFNLKKQVVQDYLDGKGGYKFLAKKYDVASSDNVKRWIWSYRQFGDEGLNPFRTYKRFSFEKKLSVVKLYLSSELTYQELAIQEGINNPSLISNWVKRFQIAGPDTLRSHLKGQRKTLDKRNKKTSTSHLESSENASTEYVKELEDELLRLRIENAFLKELRRLRLEDEAKMRERRGSSTASEDSSN